MAWIDKVAGSPNYYIFEKVKVQVIDKPTGQPVLDDKGKPVMKWITRKESLETPDKETAREILGKREKRKLREKKGLPPIEEEQQPRRRYLDYLQKDYFPYCATDKADSTCEQDRIYCERFGEMMNSPALLNGLKPVVYLDDITAAHGERYKQIRFGIHKVAPATVEHEGAKLKAMLKKAVVLKHLKENPFKEVKFTGRKRESTRAHDKFLRLEKIAEFFAAVETLYPGETEFAWMIKQMYYQGLRISETVAFRAEQINLAKGIITVTGLLEGRRAGSEVKDRTARDIPIHPEMLPFYEKLVAKGRTGLVFFQRNGKPWLKRTVRDRLDRAFALAGIPWAKPHILRHSFCTHGLAAGVDPRTMQAWMGHEDLETTLSYAHVIEEHARASIMKIPTPRPAAVILQAV